MQAIKYILFYAYIIFAILLILNVFGDQWRSVTEMWHNGEFFPGFPEQGLTTEEGHSGFDVSPAVGSPRARHD